MAKPLRLFDLFGDFSPYWPAWIREPGTQGDDPGKWLNLLNSCVEVVSVRTASAPDCVALDANLKLTTSSAFFYPNSGFPFEFKSLLGFHFYIQDVPPPNDGLVTPVRLFVAQSDTGCSVVVEGLPVEIRIPRNIIAPHPQPDVTAFGEFKAGVLDSQKVTFSEDGGSVLTHIRLQVDDEGGVVVTPAVPISFGKCRFMGIPCLAVHDFQLIPSPHLAHERTVDWVRHDITVWDASQAPDGAGCYAVRSLHLDPEQNPTKKVLDLISGREKVKLNGGKPAGPAYLVLDDLVVSAVGGELPIPRHLTAGIRRDVADRTSKEDIFSLEKAPVQILFGEDPRWGLQIDKLFYMSRSFKDMQEYLEPGVSFAVQFLFGKDQVQEPKHTLTLELAENLTLRLGYKRDPNVQDASKYFFTFKILGIEIVITGVKVGYSFGLAFGAEKRDAKDCLEVLADLFISMPPLGADTSFFRLRSLSGEKLAFGIEGLGYRFGKMHLEGLALPDGVQAMFGPVALIIHEFGMVSEDGASYLSFSGGLAIKIPSGFEGGVTVKRMRFRYVGNPNAPSFKLDGIFARFAAPTILLDAGGYFTDTQVNPTTRRREFGFTGTLNFHPPLVQQMVSVDLIAGKIIGDPTFNYLMIQVVYYGAIPIYCVEITMVQGLLADEMVPVLTDFAQEAYEFRYYNWYRKKANPLTTDGMRRLQAWKPEYKALSFGMGFGVSFMGLGKLFDIRAFTMYVRGESERTLLIVFAMHLFKAPEPVAWAVVELDFAHGRYMVMVGICLSLDRIIQGFPDCLKDVVKLTGTIICGNNPTTVAIGRLRDQTSWLGLTINIDLLGCRAFLQFAYCFEWVEGGDRGTATVFRVEGGWSIGPIRLSFNAGFGWLVASFATGSNDYALEVWIEAGVRAVLFWFFRLGIKARAELRDVGRQPYRLDLTLTLTFELPWPFPDVTCKLQLSRGEVAPEKLELFVSPLQAGAAVGELAKFNLPLHVERYDRQWPKELNTLPAGQAISATEGDPTCHTYSLEQLKGMTLDEAARLQAFETDTKVEPVPTDAYVAVDFSMLVNDLLSIGTNGQPQGNQRSGNSEKPEDNLKLSYDLTGLRIRRRPRFATGIPWTVVDETRTGQKASPAGAAPQVFDKKWQSEMLYEGKTAQKRLRINSTAPFDSPYNPQMDEEMVRNNPNWPCCEGKQGYHVHRVTFRGEVPGTEITDPRFFTDSTSTLRLIPLTIARPFQVPGNISPAGTLVASIEVLAQGTVFRAELDEGATRCTVRLAWRSRTATAVLELAAYGPSGAEVGKQLFPLPGHLGFTDIELAATQPFRRFEARVIAPSGWFPSAKANDAAIPLLEIDEVSYADPRDYEEFVRRQQNCDPGRREFRQRYEGKGKLFFLPNHEYEIEVTTRLAASHPSAAEKELEVKEYVHFKTKGLPGLNAQPRVGEELEPYVKSAYGGGRGFVYREEPVTVAFTEDYLVVLPLKWRPFGGSAESDQLFELALTVTPDTAGSVETPFTTTDVDWIVAHRQIVLAADAATTAWKPVPAINDLVTSTTTSHNPVIERLATLTQRPASPCPLADPRQVISPVLVAHPQGATDPADPAHLLWPAAAGCTAVVMPAGSGFVGRETFVPDDLSAFGFGSDGAGSGEEDWRVVGGRLHVQAGARDFAILGDPDWNHLVAQVEVTPGAGQAGVGFAIHTEGETAIDPVPSRANHPVQGLFAVIESAGNGYQLAAYRRTKGNEFNRVGQPSPLLPPGKEPYTLIVHGFDDKLRLTVGEVSFEVVREAQRGGRLALVAEGDAAFASLRVKGLPMYTYPFLVSRYTNFAEHIGSFGGAVLGLTVDDMGNGATTRDVPGLWTESSQEVAQAMQPAAAAERREALFSKWAAGLGLPADQETTALTLTKFIQGGSIACLELASPETLDFVEEVTLELSRRVVVTAMRVAVDLGSTRSLIRKLLSKGRIVPRVGLTVPPKGPGPDPGPDRLEAGSQRLGSPEDLAAESEGIVDCEHVGADRIRVLLNRSLRLSGAGRDLAILEVGEPGSLPPVRAYEGALEPGAGGYPSLEAWQTMILPPGRDLDAAEQESLRRLKPGTLILVDRASGAIIGVRSPKYQYENVEVRILQNGAGTRALIVPVSPAGPVALPPGVYRLSFVMNRQRWETQDPDDELNHYKGGGAMTFEL